MAALGAAVAAAAAQAPAHAAFQGDDDPNNWTFTPKGNMGMKVDTSGAPDSIAITTPNQDTANDPKPGTSLFTIVSPKASVVSFN